MGRIELIASAFFIFASVEPSVANTFSFEAEMCGDEIELELGGPWKNATPNPELAMFIGENFASYNPIISVLTPKDRPGTSLVISTVNGPIEETLSLEAFHTLAKPIPSNEEGKTFTELQSPSYPAKSVFFNHEIKKILEEQSNGEDLSKKFQDGYLVLENRIVAYGGSEGLSPNNQRKALILEYINGCVLMLELWMPSETSLKKYLASIDAVSVKRD